MSGLKVMGIDPGLTRCGLSVVVTGKARAVYPLAVAVVRTTPDMPLTNRLQEIFQAATDWIEQYKPDVIAIERVFERGEVSTVMNTAHAVGVLILAAAKAGLEVHMYTPSEVKKAISGNGQADKRQMTLMITRILGLADPPKPADAADALALAVCHCWRAPLIKSTNQALNKLAAAKQVRTGVDGKPLIFNDRTRPRAKAVPDFSNNLGLNKRKGK